MISAAELLASGMSASQQFEVIMSQVKNFDLRAYMERSVERSNRDPGHLNEQDGIDCPLCLNRGYSFVLNEETNGMMQVDCACMTERRGVARLKRSGLGDLAARCRLDNFHAESPWQRKMLCLAQDYLNTGYGQGRWLYYGGQPGCGKTHLMTAVCTALIKQEQLKYEVWPELSRRMKANVNDGPAYDEAFERLRTVPVLAIDDFLKPVGGAAARRAPSAGDLRLAFELIAARANIGKPTLISSEWLMEELADLDEATAGRIRERCGEYALSVSRDVSRDYRMKIGG